MTTASPLKLLALVSSLFMFVVLAPVASADHCDVGDDLNCIHSHGDDTSNEVVTRGVLFPNTSADSVLGRAARRAAGCEDCEWLVVPGCLPTGPESPGVCSGAVTGCAGPGEIRYRVWLRDPPEGWVFVDTVCLGPGQVPTNVEDLGELVRERVVSLLPDAAPTFQPASGGIVNLPTLFAAGEPGIARTEAFDVVGFQVVVTASARWEWTFEPGVTVGFGVPGGAYPDMSVSHTYAGPGTREVSVTSSWTATFTVDGQGPFAVPAPEIAKTVGPIAVPVREARAELVGG